MSRALRRVRSVSVHARVTLNRGPATSISMEVQIPGRVQATIVSGNLVVNERFVGDEVYFRYNAGALLRLTHDPTIADAEANRWIELPDSKVPAAASIRHMATHSRLQECVVLGPSGRLSLGATSTLNGLATIALQDHGGRPGTARRQIIVSANAPYLPLQIIQRHPTRPGGKALSECVTRRFRSTMRRLVAVARALDREHHIRLRSYDQAIDSYDAPLHLLRPPHPLVPQSQSASGAANSVAV
jgi:hypothetical protein